MAVAAGLSAALAAADSASVTLRYETDQILIERPVWGFIGLPMIEGGFTTPAVFWANTGLTLALGPGSNDQTRELGLQCDPIFQAFNLSALSARLAAAGLKIEHQSEKQVVALDPFGNRTLFVDGSVHSSNAAQRKWRASPFDAYPRGLPAPDIQHVSQLACVGDVKAFALLSEALGWTTVPLQDRQLVAAVNDTLSVTVKPDVGELSRPSGILEIKWHGAPAALADRLTRPLSIRLKDDQAKGTIYSGASPLTVVSFQNE